MAPIKIPADLPLSQMREDGRYVLCRPCYRKGYGEDSYYPSTDEFWRTRRGGPEFSACKACQNEARRPVHAGFIPSEFAPTTRTIPLPARHEVSLRFHVSI